MVVDTAGYCLKLVDDGFSSWSLESSPGPAILTRWRSLTFPLIFELPGPVGAGCRVLQVIDQEEEQEPKDRPFKPSKTAASHATRAYVDAFLDHATRCESRQRVRSVSAQTSYQQMVAALALDLAHREISKPGGWLAVPLQKDGYTRRNRAAPFLTESFIPLIRLAHSAGLLELRIGGRDEEGVGRLSTIRASERLRDVIRSFELSYGDFGRDRALLGDPIILMSRKRFGESKRLSFEETQAVAHMREEMREINAWIAGADLWWAGDEVEDRADCSERFLCRVFNDGMLDRGGRLFGGFWQSVDSNERVEWLCFGEEPAVELDYGQMAVRSAYALAGAIPPTGDLYSIPGLEKYRAGVKRVLNALLGCEEMPTRFPRGTKKYFEGSRLKFADVLQPILRHHEAIRLLFANRLALQLMYGESQLLVAVLLRLKELGVMALPIHDCVLVAESNEHIARQVMEESFAEFIGLEGVVEVTRSARGTPVEVPANTGTTNNLRYIFTSPLEGDASA